MFLTGFIAALGLLFLLFKLGWRRVVAYDIYVDVAVTVALMAMFAGTYSGMMAAMFGGLLVSVILFVLKQTVEYEKLVLTTSELRLHPRVRIPYPHFSWVRERNS